MNFAESTTKEFLIKKLIACGMGDEKIREQVLKKFESINSEIKIRIDDANNSLGAIRNIVDKCWAFGDGFEELTDAIGEVVGATKQWKDLDEFVRTSISKSIVSYTMLKTVWTQIYDIKCSPKVLLDAYVQSVPEDRKHPDFVAASDVLMEMLKDTAKVGILSERIALLEFVARMALYASEQEQQSVADELRTWIEFTGAALKCSDRLKGVYNRAHQHREVQKAPYLLVMLDRDDTALPEISTHKSNHKYSLRAWLFDNKSELIKLLTEESGPQQITEGQTIEEIEVTFAKLLDRWLSEEDVQLIDIDKLVIEFLVPDELLKHEFDSWQIKKDQGGMKLGVDYPVVVRSLERFSGPHKRVYLSALQGKLDYFKKFEQQNYARTFMCICDSETCRLQESRLNDDPSCVFLFCSREECQPHDRLKAALRRSYIICLEPGHAPYCITAPSGSQRANTFPLFQTLRLTGMPFALWARNGIHAELVPLLKDSYFPLSSLPKKVLQWRQNATIGGEEQTGLTLLYDEDPKRLPPGGLDKQYKAAISSQ